MDSTKPKFIGKITEKSTDGMEMSNTNLEMASLNEEKDMIIERYEKVLNFLKGVTINEHDLALIKKPLDDLELNLKYIPNGPFFNDIIPAEIKNQILSYPCDSSAFIATSVCQEWKGVLETRFKNKKVIIGEDCSKCEDNECVKPEDMLKAVTGLKLDVHLCIHTPVTEVDPGLLTDALTSVSKFTIFKDYKRYGEDGDVPILSKEQFEHLFKSFEQGEKVMEEVELIGLDLDEDGLNLNQEQLANFLINNTERLTLDSVDLDFEPFITRLQQDLSTSKLTHLALRNIQYDFGLLINPQDLKSVFNKMTTLELEGFFDMDQLEAIRTLPDVEVIPDFPIFTIKKALKAQVECYDVTRYFKKL